MNYVLGGIIFALVVTIGTLLYCRRIDKDVIRMAKDSEKDAIKSRDRFQSVTASLQEDNKEYQEMLSNFGNMIKEKVEIDKYNHALNSLLKARIRIDRDMILLSRERFEVDFKKVKSLEEYLSNITELLVHRQFKKATEYSGKMFAEHTELRTKGLPILKEQEQKISVISNSIETNEKDVDKLHKQYKHLFKDKESKNESS